MRIRRQLAAVALLAGLPLVALLAWQIRAQFQAEAQSAAEAVQRVARSSATDTRRLLDETERVLGRLAQRADVQALRRERCDPAIEDFRAAIPGYANIITVNAEGVVVCSALGTAGPVSVSGYEWHQKAVGAGGFRLSRPTTSAITGAPVVYASLPLANGIIAISLALSDFAPVSEEHGLMEDTVISIVDGEGYMIARSGDARTWVGTNVRGQGVVDIVLERKSGYVVAPGLYNVERVFGFAPVPRTSWVVYTGVRSDAVFAAARTTAMRTAALAALVLIAAAAAVMLLARRVAGEVSADASLLQRVIDTVPAIVYVKDPGGRYRLVNRGFQELTNLAPEQVVGRADAELFPADTAAVLARHDRRALASGGVLTTEETLPLRDGSTRRYLAGTASLRDNAGRPLLMCTAAVDITATKRLEERQRQLARRVFEVSEEERQRLSRELHDRIGQPLAALRINLDVLRRELPAAAGPGLDRQTQLIEEVIRLVRQLTAELRPAELDDIGLAAALRSHGEQAADRYGFEVDVLGAELRPRLPRAAERALFRIAQEALANAAKHARAQAVTIELEAQDGEATLSVVDDGAGFDTDRKASGYGLLTMRERVEEVGGRLEVESVPGHGTRIMAAVPLR